MNPWMISLLAGYLALREMQKKQFMLLFSRLASPGASPVGKVNLRRQTLYKQRQE